MRFYLIEMCDENSILPPEAIFLDGAAIDEMHDFAGSVVRSVVALTSVSIATE